MLQGKTMNKAVSKPKGKSNFASFRTEMIKRKAALAAATKAAEVETENKSKTFDGGFFAVQSPVHPASSKKHSCCDD